MPYIFAPGVSACLADGRLVLLNVILDRYLMLPPDVEASLRRLLGNERDTAADPALRERLCTHGLILCRGDGPAPALCAQAPATHSLLDGDLPARRNLDLAAAATRVAAAGAALRFLGLERSLRLAAVSRVSPSDDPGRVFGQAAAFARLRLALRSLDRCLPLSLALAGMARRHHSGVRLVLGVKCNPFGAHAWVQLDGTALNDHLDAVRAFTPILAI